jgi:hypothetical protein
MEYQITWGGDPEDVMVVTSGDASVEELDAMVQDVTADPRFRHGMKVLLDHSSLRLWAMSNDDVRRRADLVKRDTERVGRQRVAFVTGSPVDFGIGRMLQGLTADTGIEGGVFDSVAAARDWLRDDRPS